MKLEMKRPDALAGASGAIFRVPAFKTQRQKNSRTALLLQWIATFASGFFPLFGAFIDLRAVAFAVRGAVRRDAEVGQ
jgi:membrane associated rhomboid family serine protease